MKFVVPTAYTPAVLLFFVGLGLGIGGASAQPFCIHDLNATGVDLATGKKNGYQHLYHASKAGGKYPLTFNVSEIYADLHEECCKAKNENAADYLVEQMCNAFDPQSTTTNDLPTTLGHSIRAIKRSTDDDWEVHQQRFAPAFGDLTGDQKPDLVVAYGLGILMYFENTATSDTAAFTHRAGSSNPFRGTGVAKYNGGKFYPDPGGTKTVPVLIDLDGDDDLDLVIGPSGPWFWENTGTKTSPTFAVDNLGCLCKKADGDCSTPEGSDCLQKPHTNPVLGDVDGDGDKDLILVETQRGKENKVLFYKNNGTATGHDFVEQIGDTDNPFSRLYVADGEYELALVDTDRDGDLDVVASEKWGKFIFYENIGSPFVPTFSKRLGMRNPFQKNLNYLRGGTEDHQQRDAHFAFVDLNNDGYLECAISSDRNAWQDEELFAIFELQVEKGKTFTLASVNDNPLARMGNLPAPHDAAGWGPLHREFAIGDVNGDGFVDFLFEASSPSRTNCNGELANDCVVTYFQSDGEGGLVQVSQTDSTNPFRNLPHKWQEVQAPKDYEGWKLQRLDNHPRGITRHFTFADLDDDGDVDLVMFPRYFENDGDVFIERDRGTDRNPFGPFSGTCIECWDHEPWTSNRPTDKWGYQDLQVAYTITGTTISPTGSSVHAFVGQHTLVDLDADEDLDLVVDLYGYVYVFYNTGTKSSPNFDERGVKTDAFGHPTAADIDGDGVVDLLTQCDSKRVGGCDNGGNYPSEVHEIVYFKWNGANFQRVQLSNDNPFDGLYAKYIHFADLNRDGLVDLVASTNEDRNAYTNGACTKLDFCSWGGPIEHQVCKCMSPTVTGNQCQSCKSNAYRKTATDTIDLLYAMPPLCVLCPAGFYSTQVDSMECSECAAGKYRESSDSACNSCPAGRYNDQVGKSSCLPCVPGKHAPSKNSTKCLPCDENKYQNDMAQNSCKSCVKGRSSEIGSVECSACLAGKYEQADGLGCVECNGGQYTDSSNENSCKFCPVGRYQNQKDQTSCLPCLPGRYADDTGWQWCKDCNVGMYRGTSNTNSTNNANNAPSLLPSPQPTTDSTSLLPSPQPTTDSTLLPASGESAGCENLKNILEEEWSNTNGQTCNQFTADSCRAHGSVPGPEGGNANYHCCACGGGYRDANGFTWAFFFADNLTDNMRTSYPVCSNNDTDDEENNIGLMARNIGYDNLITDNQCSELQYFCDDQGLGMMLRWNTCTATCCNWSSAPATRTGCENLKLRGGREWTNVGGQTCNQLTVPDDCNIDGEGGTANTHCCVCGGGSGARRRRHLSEHVVKEEHNCQSCPTGTYQPEKGRARCLDCQKGQYNDEPKATTCKQCAKDTATDQMGRTTVCDPCNAGESAEEGSTKCDRVPCRTGRFKETGTGKCMDCPRGWNTEKLDAEKCQQCPLGTTTPEQGGSGVCLPCDPGTHGDEQRQGVCVACENGLFQNVKGQRTCENCKGGKVPNDNATACENPHWGACKPTDEYLHDVGGYARYAQWYCKRCPEGADCSSDGATWSGLLPKPGYWRVPAPWTDEDHPFTKCPYINTCGATNCTAGNVGTACGVCDKDHFRSANGACLPCSMAVAKTLENALPPLITGLILLILGYWKRKRIKELRRRYAKLWRDIVRIATISISFAQINGSLSIVVPVEWPQEYLNFIGFMQFVDFDVLKLFSVGCVDGIDYRFRVLFACSVPLLVTTVSAAAHFLCRRSTDKDDSSSVRSVALLYLFDLVDKDKSGGIDAEEFESLLEQMKHPVKSRDETFKLMKKLGAKDVAVSGGSILTLMRGDVLEALRKRKVNAVLGSHWVSITENRRRTSEHLSTMLLLLFMFHAPVSQRLFHFFACHPIGDGGKETRSFLRADYSMECYVDKHRDFIPIVGIFLGCFTLLFPAIVLTILCKNRKRLYTPSVQNSYGFLYSRFNKGAEMWEIHEVLRKLVLMGALLFLPSSSRAAIAILVCLVACCTLNYFRPHRNKIVLGVSQTAFLFSALKYVFAVLLMSGNRMEARDKTTMGWILVALDLIFMIGSLTCMLVLAFMLRTSVNLAIENDRKEKLAPCASEAKVEIKEAPVKSVKIAPAKAVEPEVVAVAPMGKTNS